MIPKKLFIGYDEGEAQALHTLIQSILEHTTEPISITPILKKQLKAYTRSRTKLESSDFSLTRFLVPYLSDYQGWSLYCDCDFIFTDDISKIFDLANDKYSVMTCKHNYKPSLNYKKLNAIQNSYNYKNWSSLMLFNCGSCQSLTPEYINRADGLELHQFKWLSSLDLIGEIPMNWNYLVDEENQTLPAKGVHYTNGICLTNRVSPDFAELWLKYYNKCKLNIKETRFMPGSDMVLSDSIVEIDNIEYVVIPPLFKNSITDNTDYIQLVDSLTNRIHHLKDTETTFRGYSQRIAYIKCQHVGSMIALELGLNTQSTRLIQIKDQHLCLLTVDIRGSDTIYKMEPLVHLSHNIIEKEEKNPHVLIDEINLCVGRDEANFFTTMLLFDHLISNSYRDAKSIRIIFDQQERKRNDEIDLCCDVLIENNLGSSVLFANNKNENLSLIEILSFLIERKTFFAALKFIKSIDTQRIYMIIDREKYITTTDKAFFKDTIKTQYLELVELQKMIEEKILNEK
jgi:hypothetical protein